MFGILATEPAWILIHCMTHQEMVAQLPAWAMAYLMPPEAVAAVSDGNGDILFYTDGQTMVFVTKDPATGDNVHLQPVPVAGGNIGGDPASSQVIMVQVPDTDGMYYVFTTTAVENGGFETEIFYCRPESRGGSVC